jgi:molybdenum cofactor biosynthesis enzyme MoaA
MINQRLFDHYKINTGKNLNIKTVCARPYDTLLIDKNGSCYACECTAWLPQSIGNLQLRTLDEIINSNTRQHLQDSVTDGTYRYCNEHQCAYLKNRPRRIQAMTDQRIKHLRLAIDDSCNLRCPSCRKGLIFHKEGSAYNLGIRLADKINGWLHDIQHPVQVHLGSDGDPFASHVYRHFMEQTPKKDIIKYSILTNGLMFKEFHGTVPYVINNLQELGVSIDGASKETYEKLRLGGKWEKMMEGLECMAELKEKHNFKLKLHFVVQEENFREVRHMIDLAEQVNADGVYFNPIQDWGTFTNWKSKNINDPEHPDHAELVDIMRDVSARPDMNEGVYMAGFASIISPL